MSIRPVRGGTAFLTTGEPVWRLICQCRIFFFYKKCHGIPVSEIQSPADIGSRDKFERVIRPAPVVDPCLDGAAIDPDDFGRLRDTAVIAVFLPEKRNVPGFVARRAGKLDIEGPFLHPEDGREIFFLMGQDV